MPVLFCGGMLFASGCSTSTGKRDAKHEIRKFSEEEVKDFFKQETKKLVNGFINDFPTWFSDQFADRFADLFADLFGQNNLAFTNYPSFNRFVRKEFTQFVPGFDQVFFDECSLKFNSFVKQFVQHEHKQFVQHEHEQFTQREYEKVFKLITNEVILAFTGQFGMWFGRWYDKSLSQIFVKHFNNGTEEYHVSIEIEVVKNGFEDFFKYEVSQFVNQSAQCKVKQFVQSFVKRFGLVG